MATKMTAQQKREMVINAFKKAPKGMTASVAFSTVKLDKADVLAIVAQLLKEKVLAKNGEIVSLVASTKAAPSAQPARKGKPAPEPEEDEDEDEEMDIVEEFNELDELDKLKPAQKKRKEELLDLMVDEFTELDEKAKRSKAENARHTELEEILEANDMFEGDEDVPDDEDEDEGQDDEDTEELDEEDDAEDEDDELDESEDEDDEEDGWGDDEDDDEEDVPVRKPASKGKVAPVVVPPANKMFQLAYDTIDKLTVTQLAERIVAGTNYAKTIAKSNPEIAELIMRSVAKARSQHAKKTA